MFTQVLSLPMNESSVRYIGGYLNKHNRPIFYKGNRSNISITNNIWSATKFNSIKKCQEMYGKECKVFKLDFQYNLEVKQ